jgi:NitT/TauT family transport system ATP-binding protein
LPVLANSLQLEAEDISPLGESLQLLRFAQLSEGDLVLTDAGMRFANLETDARKKLFAEHLLHYVPVMGLIRRVLDERPSQRRPKRASATSLRTICRKIRPTKRSRPSSHGTTGAVA